MNRSKILVSACLMGQNVRYDGASKPLQHPALTRWGQEGRLVVICPEVSAGFAIPRPPAEIGDGKTGSDVLDGRATVIEINGGDVTDLFVQGAQNALALARENGCLHALLIDGSPSCGSSFIHDGSFSGKRKEGQGVVAALLRQNGITVWSHNDIEAMVKAVDGIELT